jgi:threonine/homoserine/homoserine lactone efflux protein
MPKSKSRKSKEPAYTPPPAKKPESFKIGNPVWLAPVMVTMFILGLLWIVVFYLIGSQVPLMVSLSQSPIRELANVLIGFAFIGIGFALATRWK